MISLLRKLETSKYVDWDARDIFDVKAVSAIFAKLEKLEPTQFVAQSYLSILVKHAVARIKVNYSDVLFNDEFIKFSSDIKAEIKAIDGQAKPHMDAFTEIVLTNVEKFSGEPLYLWGENVPEGVDRNNGFNVIRRDDITLLARDAIFATEMPIHWIYSKSSEQGPHAIVKSLHNDILLFPSLISLEIAIHTGKLAHGFHYVTINNKSLPIYSIVYVSPFSAFIMTEANWDRHNFKMVGQAEKYRLRHDGLDSIDRHFPSLDTKHKLTLVTDAFQVIGSLKTAEAKSKVWLLMLIELLAIKLEQITPVVSSASLGLVATPEMHHNLPTQYVPPYQIQHKDIATLAREIGVDDSCCKAELWAVINTLSIDTLMPKTECYFNVETLKLQAEHSKANTDLQSVTITLLPYPHHHFGDQQSVTDAINYVLTENLAYIVNAVLRYRWGIEINAMKKTLSELANDQHKHISKFAADWSETELPFNPRQYNLHNGFAGGHVEKLRRLAVKTHNKNRYLPTAVNQMSSSYKQTTRFAGGWVSKSRLEDGCPLYIISPNSTEELTQVLNCQVSDLPKLLKNWERREDHDRIIYPWSMNARNRYIVAMILFYY
ncbi:hypothetical protein OCF84_21505 (plasmid) [Shewanella xiamenensis]|uniref:Uncharacterized protein n=1 Tax=Shewanella xiamenensis TaxID=332186 RepID=A0ABT6UDT3_9GAMM|nr:hypothetical protein [Shewanella xiamenensis]MDI5832546.1 hypothetical protein [Shewanella xiamenensis]WHF57836.1 hypothetical protein OCF84_21505 [Shewanella xiamenensis]